MVNDIKKLETRRCRMTMIGHLIRLSTLICLFCGSRIAAKKTVTSKMFMKLIFFSLTGVVTFALSLWLEQLLTAKVALMGGIGLMLLMTFELAHVKNKKLVQR
ncbi:hypothetical protein [Lacticaseibacillus paracasei]|jgi:hypothetical protein|uniref:hypothetical protein n=1 Tax=Lacticaseibacillus paracasei TaxID=1597 RepID=UPI001267CE8F|nr:hypothetical protein [Lacticaseibacillus paracasei]MBS0992295.1 hypothetical protein [Lacticaseibacillus paracasei]MBT9262419.1 hypothetical protein [Lacticaseibacillus paracasei]MDE3278266.1 hypothetical protein [Lacticaseibacillus paracasei]QPC22106.1 hypothetical protein LacP0625_00700 [Lacticaseibacillus paracasei subsp. tolerans]UJS07949.1 hypothetical protein L3C06_00710 [Lacticaseibacillus paracasei subsp. paracasei]